MVKKKIAITGKAKAGKNTLAELLGQESGLNYKILAFADPIKEMVMQMWPNTNRQVLWGPSELRSLYIPEYTIPEKTFDGYCKPLCYRDIIVHLGTYGRSINPNIWINSTISKVNIFLEEENIDLAIISDCRYQNEFTKVKNNNFTVIKITRSNNDYNYNHDSEKDLDNIPDSNFDYIINNDDQDINILRLKAKELLANILF